MNWYTNLTTQQERQFDENWFNACVAAGNPKVDGWTLMSPQPTPLPPPPSGPHRVSKDTITNRVLEANKLSEMINIISNLDTQQQFLWDNFSWFWSNNQTIISMCQQIDLDPNTILAPDPYI
jgi:hypothetical protein